MDDKDRTNFEKQLKKKKYILNVLILIAVLCSVLSIFSWGVLIIWFGPFFWYMNINFSLKQIERARMVEKIKNNLKNETKKISSADG